MRTRGEGQERQGRQKGKGNRGAEPCLDCSRGDWGMAGRPSKGVARPCLECDGGNGKKAGRQDRGLGGGPCLDC